MKYLRKFNESSINKPIKRFPNIQAVHTGYIEKLVKDAGMDPHKLSESDLNIPLAGGGHTKTTRDHTIYDYFFQKCKHTVIYPNFTDVEYLKRAEKKRGSYYIDHDFIHRESVFLIPKSHNSRQDQADYIERKTGFFNNMRNILGNKEYDKTEQDLEDMVDHGITEYSWINPVLKLLHDKLGKYYKNDTLQIWMPKDRDYDPWEGMDNPHKYNVIGKLTRPNGVYFLSDIEKYIHDKYGISDDKFYDFIIHNEYIEGRYWERVWSLGFKHDEKYKTIFPLTLSKGREKHGMIATKNIEHMLNIIQKDFGNEFVDSDYDAFPIYVDYYKEVKNER